MDSELDYIHQKEGPKKSGPSRHCCCNDTGISVPDYEINYNRMIFFDQLAMFAPFKTEDGERFLKINQGCAAKVGANTSESEHVRAFDQKDLVYSMES